jgi:hypothetical protein
MQRNAKFFSFLSFAAWRLGVAVFSRMEGITNMKWMIINGNFDAKTRRCKETQSFFFSFLGGLASNSTFFKVLRLGVG